MNILINISFSRKTLLDEVEIAAFNGGTKKHHGKSSLSRFGLLDPSSARLLVKIL
jgi:hypothetical protein